MARTTYPTPKGFQRALRKPIVTIAVRRMQNTTANLVHRATQAALESERDDFAFTQFVEREFEAWKLNTSEGYTSATDIRDVRNNLVRLGLLTI